MIPAQNIIAPSQQAPWAEQRQVEQDLIISRELVVLFAVIASLEGVASAWERLTCERYAACMASGRAGFTSPIWASMAFDLTDRNRPS